MNAEHLDRRHIVIGPHDGTEELTGGKDFLIREILYTEKWFLRFKVGGTLFVHHFKIRLKPSQQPYNTYKLKGEGGGKMHIRTWLATTASCGSSGSAAANKACSDRRTVLSVIAAALQVKAHNHKRSSTLWTSWLRKVSIAGRQRWRRSYSFLKSDKMSESICLNQLLCH